MNRRKLLSAGPAALAVVSGINVAQQSGIPALLPAAPPDPDAELHALCATYHRQGGMSRDEGNPGWEAAADARHAAFMQIMPMVPITEAGHRAKAAVAVAEMDDNRCDGEWVGDTEALFALDTLKGWLGMPT